MGLNNLEHLEKRWVQYTSRIRELHKKINEMEKDIDELGHKAAEVLSLLSIMKPDHPVVQYYRQRYGG